MGLGRSGHGCPARGLSLQTALIVVLLGPAVLGVWTFFRQPREKGDPVLVLRDTYVGVIFQRNVSLFDVSTSWEPTVRDVERAERCIPEFIRSKAPQLSGRLHEYGRQYFGIMVDGRRVVFCSFIHRSENLANVTVRDGEYYLRTIGVPALVVDGGDHFFQLNYDPETDTCSDLHINAVS